MLMALSPEKIDSIEAKAADTLDFAYTDGKLELPINLEKVAVSYGLEIKNATFKNPDVVGFYDRNSKKIYVDKNDPFGRKSFTIAHELGHHILHQEKTSDVFLRLDSLNLDLQDKEDETEANWFAASLLMPKKILSAYWEKIHDVEILAQIFGVSKTAMVWRLKNLGFTDSI